MTDFAALLRSLTAARARYIVVGGAAATAHGAARLTVDLDIVYLVAALAEFNPYFSPTPKGGA